MVDSEERVSMKQLTQASHVAKGSILKHTVRAFGAFSKPAAFSDLLPFLEHPDRSVVCGTIESMIELDRDMAVRIAKRLVKSAKLPVAFWVTLILSRKCEPESREFLLGLTTSTRTRDRLAALVYLRTRSPRMSVPIALDMMRRERDSEVRALLVRLLIRRASKGHVLPLLELREDLKASVGEIDRLLDSLQAKRQTGKTEGDKSIPPVTDRTMMAKTKEGGVERPPRPRALRPRPALVCRRIVPCLDRRGVFGFLAGSVALLLGVGALFLTCSPPPPRIPPSPSQPRPANALGDPGSSVDIVGEVLEIQSESRCVFIETDGAMRVLVRLSNRDLEKLVIGRTVRIHGVLKPFKLDGAHVVQGLSVDQH